MNEIYIMETPDGYVTINVDALHYLSQLGWSSDNFKKS